MLNNNTDVNGNKDVKALLDQFRQQADTVPMGYSAVVGAVEPNQFMMGFSGTVELEKVVLEGLSKTSDLIKANILNRTLPERNPEMVASGNHVVYNITCSPLSFDFTTWLINMETRRLEMGAPGPLRVAFWLGRDGKTGLSGMPDRNGMLNNVCRPALDLLGAVEDPIAIDGYAEEFFSYKPIIERVKKGIKIPNYTTANIPGFKNPFNFEPGYITVTFRETTYWPHRNSNLEEWMRFANYLTVRGERVIFVRDTAKAEEPFGQYPICPLASKNLYARCALYENAKCNMFVANGPVSLAYFGAQPWLKFFYLDDQGAYNAAKTAYWQQCVGIDPVPGGQFPWSTDKQRIVWQPDYYTNMVVAWEGLNIGLMTRSIKKACTEISGTNGMIKPQKNVKQSKIVTNKTKITKA